MNHKIWNISDRQAIIDGPDGRQVYLPIDCYVSSAVVSKSSKVACFVLYQRDIVRKMAGHYYGLLCLSQMKSIKYSFHLGRMEMNLMENSPFVWSVVKIEDSLLTQLEVGYQNPIDGEHIEVSYRNEEWQLQEGATGILVRGET